MRRRVHGSPGQRRTGERGRRERRGRGGRIAGVCVAPRLGDRSLLLADGGEMADGPRNNSNESGGRREGVCVVPRLGRSPEPAGLEVANRDAKKVGRCTRQAVMHVLVHKCT